MSGPSGGPELLARFSIPAMRFHTVPSVTREIFELNGTIMFQVTDSRTFHGTRSRVPVRLDSTFLQRMSHSGIARECNVCPHRVVARPGCIRRPLPGRPVQVIQATR
ncbi:hypothetical protein GF325_01600 [Candidatus Bathyarchaeota archaeon]|nr:hypothetical protein [Candidatus Bathyarchaeota archaeon]